MIKGQPLRSFDLLFDFLVLVPNQPIRTQLASEPLKVFPSCSPEPPQPWEQVIPGYSRLFQEGGLGPQLRSLR